MTNRPKWTMHFFLCVYVHVKEIPYSSVDHCYFAHLNRDSYMMSIFCTKALSIFLYVYVVSDKKWK